MTDVRSADALRTTGNLAVFEGLLLTLGGVLLIVTPFAAVTAFTQVTGVLLVFGGIVGIIRNAGSGHGEHGGGAGVLGPILAAIAGAVLLIDPTLAATFMVTVIGAILLVSGARQVAAACGMHGRDHWIAFPRVRDPHHHRRCDHLPVPRRRAAGVRDLRGHPADSHRDPDDPGRQPDPSRVQRSLNPAPTIGVEEAPGIGSMPAIQPPLGT